MGSNDSLKESFASVVEDYHPITKNIRSIGWDGNQVVIRIVEDYQLIEFIKIDSDGKRWKSKEVKKNKVGYEYCEEHTWTAYKGVE